MMNLRILIALVAAAIILTLLAVGAMPAGAQEVQIPRCLPHDEMAATLLEKAKEHPVMIGINKELAVVETYASLSGTWTNVTTDMNTGQSCITDFGANFQMHPMSAPGRDASQ